MDTHDINALHQARDNGYLVMKNGQDNPEDWPCLPSREIWEEYCYVEDIPAVYAECYGEETRITIGIEDAPYPIYYEGHVLLDQLGLRLHIGDCYGPGLSVPIEEMDRVARQIIAMAKRFGAPESGGKPPIDWKPATDWAQWLNDAYFVQSPDEMAELGYVLNFNDKYNPHDWFPQCAKWSLPFVEARLIDMEGFCQPNDRFTLLLDMTTTPYRLTPKGMQRAMELFLPCLGEKTEITVTPDRISVVSIPVERVHEVARRLFMIGCIYVYDAPANQEGDPE